MATLSTNRKRLLLTALLFVLFLFCGSVKSEAKWIQNSNGTYSWEKPSGKIAKSTWIKSKYYVDENGVRVTGRYEIKGKYYYFKPTNGAVLKSTWIKSGKKYYYAKKNGVLCTKERHKIGSYYYYFNKNSVRKTGFKTINGNTYYFDPDHEGRMVAKDWACVDGNYYRFSRSGKLRKSTWVCNNKYYVNSEGISVTGLQTINGKLYYFDKSTRRKVTNTTKIINNVTYEFDSSGVGTEVTTGQRNSTRTDLHSQYYTDPAVDDATLLASIIYCEAGNQTSTGQLAVGLVILNRVRSSQFPNTFAEVIYQNQQFEPARTGSLTSCLKNGTATSSCKSAAATVLSLYQSGGTATLSGYGDFSGYLFFMTPASYNSLGLRAPYLKIGGHYFLKSWY